jgi:hypothetical protein
MATGLVDVLHWGCACYSAIDCNSAEGTMIFYDPGQFEAIFESTEAEENGDEPIKVNPAAAFRLQAVSLEQWYEDWLVGNLKMGYDKPRWLGTSRPVDDLPLWQDQKLR